MLPALVGPSELPACSRIFLSWDQVRMNLWEHVKKQMFPFLSGKTGESLPADCPVRSQLVLGLSILFMVEAVDFTVPKKDLDALCYILIPSTGSAEALHSGLSPVLSNPQRYLLVISYMSGCFSPMSGAHGGWKVLDLLEMELHTAMSRCVDTGN